MRKLFFPFAMVSFILFIFSFNTQANSFPQAMFILDGSGSMWAEAGEKTKIETAKAVMDKIVPMMDKELEIGLAVYGHRKKGDCKDIEIMVSPGSANRDAILEKVHSINPKGMTPLADSILQVAELVKGNENETTIILVSDGRETCHDDPCGVVKALKTSGINFVLHVVGFGIQKDEKEQLSCLAEAGGGKFFAADNADELLPAMEKVEKEISVQVEKAKTKKKTVKTMLGKMRIRMPKKTTISVNTFRIIRKIDGKTIKTIENPKEDSTHPLLSGEYELQAGFANSNYKPDSNVFFGTWKVKGGETVEILLGAMVINLADALKDIPAGAVIITREGEDEFRLELPYTGNNYYFYKPKPLPEGVYNFGVHYQKTYLYKTGPKPVFLENKVEIQPLEESVVTLDCGIQIKEPSQEGITKWELVPQAGEAPFLTIQRASNGDYPLWKPYAVIPGTYDLNMYMEGMEAPLPVVQGVEIPSGTLFELDTGL